MSGTLVDIHTAVESDIDNNPDLVLDEKVFIIKFGDALVEVDQVPFAFALDDVFTTFDDAVKYQKDVLQRYPEVRITAETVAARRAERFPDLKYS